MKKYDPQWSNSDSNALNVKSILFVCLGNICRSPAAEEVMRQVLRQRGIDGVTLDSAGLYGGHAGQRADQRMRVHAGQRGYRLTHLARKVSEVDFDDFDLIVAMDDNNYRDLRNMAPTLEDERKVVRMTDFSSPGTRYSYVPDPYYEGSEGFELVLDLLEDACSNLADRLQDPCGE